MCDTIVTLDGDTVGFAKNSDRDPNESQVLEWFPASEHAPGAVTRCTEIEIPQVARTHAVLLSRPFWMWGAEMGTNEHGVTIGNEAVFTDQPYATSGLLGMDLLRLALERAATADDAVQVMIELLERHGQGGGHGHEHRDFTYHNSYLVADPAGAVVLETAGRHWATERVTGPVRSISNGLTIPGFAEAHADRLRGAVASCAARRRATEAGARGARDAFELRRVLRDHGAPTPTYRVHNGAMSAPCMHAGGVLAASQTTASWVSELVPGGARHWATGTAAPCTAVFVPVAVDAPADLGPTPTDRYDPTTWWWRHEDLHRAALRDPAFTLPQIARQREPLERELRDVPTAEAVARVRAVREQWLTDPGIVGRSDVRPWLIRRYWDQRDRRAGRSPSVESQHAGV